MFSFQEESLYTIHHFAAWSAIPKGPWASTNQPSHHPAFSSFSFFPPQQSCHPGRGQRGSCARERSAFSFNERAWEAWDPWADASVSEPAVLPPLLPLLNLTFQVLQLLRRKTGRKNRWSPRLMVISGDIIIVGSCGNMYQMWNVVSKMWCCFLLSLF